MSAPSALSLVTSSSAEGPSTHEAGVPAPGRGASTRVYIHRIDSRDVITYVNEQWLGFARANGAAGLAHNVIGRPLWDFVARDEPKELYRNALETVRTRGIAIQIPFRADSPSLRRHMEMRIEPSGTDEIEFRSFTIREEEREPLALLDPEAPRAAWETLTVCSLCRKALVGTRWLELEDAVQAVRAPDGGGWHRLSETVCGTCEGLVALQLRGSGSGDRPPLAPLA